MKALASKTSKTASRTATQVVNQPFFAKIGSSGFFAPAIQAKMTVNKPGDKFEQEADKMANKVMRMPTPPAPTKEERLQKAEPEEKLQKTEDDKLQKAEPEERLQKAEDDKLQKAEPKEKLQKAEDDKLQKAEPEEKIQKQEQEKLQRKANPGSPAVNASIQSSIQNKTTGGRPLASETRSYMEPRFSADFSNVRIHSDTEAASLSNQLSARAFTYQNHIFFSRDQYQPGTSEGKHLLAHELTHTIQQGHSIQRSPRVSTTSTQPHIQRSGDGAILDWFAEKANIIPGFRMFTIILGMNPINMSNVDRSAANILRALIEFMPGGSIITTALDNHGIINKVATWVEQQIRAFGMVGQMFKNALTQFIEKIGLTDLAPWNWGNLWNKAKQIFTAPINRLISFAVGAVAAILRFIKDAILKPLAALAKGTRGYDLLCALLGEDPITSKPVPRNADTLIGGFMKFIGQEEIWNNLKKGNAVARAWAWFQGALAGLLNFACSIPGRIVATLTSLTIEDILTVARAFSKIVGTFASIAGQFVSWAFNQVVSLLEILFSVVAPGAIPYIKKAKGAFVTILKSPITFAGHLVQAGKLGFQLFAGNILQHLKAALIKWIVGPLGDAGVYIPQSFSLIEIIKLVLSVLSLTWQSIRAKLVKIIPDPILVGLEKTADILVTLVTKGPVAAWEQIKAELTELKDQLIAQVTEMVSTEVVKAAVVKLASMLSPVGAVIQSIISIYNTISFFIEKAGQIAAVVGSFINSIAAIAAGQVMNAAKRVEQTMASTLTVVIAFLAKFAGLGNIPRKIVGIIQKVRKPIDRGLDKIVGWLGGMLKKLGGKLFGKKKPDKHNQQPAKPDKPKKNAADIKRDKQKEKEKKKRERLEKAVKAIQPKLQRMVAKGKTSGLLVRARLVVWKIRYRLSRLAFEGPADHPKVVARVNPSEDILTFVRKHGGALRKIIYEVAREIFSRPDVQKAFKKHQVEMEAGSGSQQESLCISTPAESLAFAKILSERRKQESLYVEFAGGGQAAVDRQPTSLLRAYYNKRGIKDPMLSPGLQHVRKGGCYKEHPAMFIETAVREGKTVGSMHSSINITQLGGGSPHHTQSARDFAAQQALLKIVEMSRSGQAIVVSMEQAQQVGHSQITHLEGMHGDPMTHVGSTTHSPELERRTTRHKGDGDVKINPNIKDKNKVKVMESMIEQQIRFIASVMEARYSAQNVMFKDEHGLTQAVRDDVKKAVKQITEQNLGLGPDTNSYQYSKGKKKRPC
ncbi:MAG: DUF4157 domain-containing protein [Thioploca sp.]|nr:DUF4157 domain-containing protein [Thioploca sp.]